MTRLKKKYILLEKKHRRLVSSAKSEEEGSSQSFISSDMSILRPSPLDAIDRIDVGDRIGHLKDHGREAGLSTELFESGHKKQRIFGVLTLDFHQVIPVLLVSVLGRRGSPKYVRLID